MIRGAAVPKGSMTYASPVSVIITGEVWAKRLRYGRQGWNFGLELGTIAFRLKWGLGFRTWSWDFGFEA